ncbi:MAG TPA: AMP-binding protein [Candidatus Dormibacteraeota bacterium]|jgi:o-succinylbenzoate---CoA ligase|nr:AMP-binding protein [Candidatus Dormibacteraeota bacterium]
MTTSALRRALRAGDLVAVERRPGPAWLTLLRHARDAGAAVLPIDVRLSAPERAALIGVAQPTLVADENGIRRADGSPIDPAIALVVATSGTSGQARLAELPAAAVEAAVLASASAIDARAEDRWLSCLPLAHIGGLLVPERHLLIGAPVTFRRRLTRSVVAGLRDVRFTSLVPTQLTRLLDAGADLGRFRAILVGGSGVGGALNARAADAGARVVPTYGMTETCGGVVYAGQPLSGVEVRAARWGELLIRGPTLMRGYRLDPEASVGAFEPGGWLRTGDGGEVEPNGTVRVFGRIAHVIVSGGEKIWPAEVEAAISSHADVAAVVVSGTPDGEWGERVVARVVPRRRAHPPTLGALRDHAAATIARHKLPRELVLVERLDHTALGKIRRR